MKQITVSRKGTVWFNDYYEVPEINEETIQKCIDDSSEYFLSSELLFETWEPTGEIEVIDEETNETLFDKESSLIVIKDII